MPGPTLEAFADHGQVGGDTVTYDSSRRVLDQLAKFEKSWDELGATIAAELKRQH
jgi:hypothetical protein